jgi:hypothetical protein
MNFTSLSNLLENIKAIYNEEKKFRIATPERLDCPLAQRNQFKVLQSLKQQENIREDKEMFSKWKNIDDEMLKLQQKKNEIESILMMKFNLLKRESAFKVKHNLQY